MANVSEAEPVEAGFSVNNARKSDLDLFCRILGGGPVVNQAIIQQREPLIIADISGSTPVARAFQKTAVPKPLPWPCKKTWSPDQEKFSSRGQSSSSPDTRCIW